MQDELRPHPVSAGICYTPGHGPTVRIGLEAIKNAWMECEPNSCSVTVNGVERDSNSLKQQLMFADFAMMHSSKIHHKNFSHCQTVSGVEVKGSPK